MLVVKGNVSDYLADETMLSEVPLFIIPQRHTKALIWSNFIGNDDVQISVEYCSTVLKTIVTIKAQCQKMILLI